MLVSTCQWARLPLVDEGKTKLVLVVIIARTLSPMKDKGVDFES